MHSLPVSTFQKEHLSAGYSPCSLPRHRFGLALWTGTLDWHSGLSSRNASPPGEALRDGPNNGCEGDYFLWQPFSSISSRATFQAALQLIERL